MGLIASGSGVGPDGQPFVAGSDLSRYQNMAQYREWATALADTDGAVVTLDPTPTVKEPLDESGQ